MGYAGISVLACWGFLSSPREIARTEIPALRPYHLPIISVQYRYPRRGSETHRLRGQFGFWLAALLSLAILTGLAPEAEAQNPQVPIILEYPKINIIGRVVEGNAIKFTVRRVGDTSQELTLNVRIDGKTDPLGLFRFKPTDANDFDYSKTTSSLIIAAGDTAPQTITVDAKSDTTYEPFERYDLVVSGTYGGADFEVRLEGRLSDAVRPTVGLTYKKPFRITEGDKGTVTFTMSHLVPHPVNVNYSIMSRHTTSTETVGDGGATMADHEVRSGTVTIPANTSSATLDVQTVEDAVPEPEEQFVVILGGVVNVRAPDTPHYNPVDRFTSNNFRETVVVTIVDDDTPKPQQRLVYLSGDVSGGLTGTTQATLDEGKDAKLTVTLVGDPPTSDISIPLKFTVFPAGEATSSDYRIPASVTIKSGQKSGSVTLQIVDDSLDERYNEILAVEIDDSAGSWPQGYTKGDRNRFEVVMRDNDKTSASLQNLSRAALTEAAGARTATFQLNVARMPKGAVTGTAPFAGVNLAEGHARFNLRYTGTAERGPDYRSATEITIPEGSASLPGGCSSSGGAVACTVTLTVDDDNLYEGGSGTTENVKIDLDVGNSHFNDGIARAAGYKDLSLTIEDNDTRPTFSIADASGPEDGNFTFTVTRSGALGNDVSVTAATGNHDGATNPATAGTDYTAKTESLRFKADDSQETFQVAVTDDNFDEPDETFAVTLSGPVDNDRLPAPGIAAGGGTATGTITDNDPAPVLSIDNPSVTEGDTTPATLTFTVTLATASGKTVTVNYADRLTGTATSATDYTALTAGTLTFAPGDTAKTIDVTVAGDTTDEPNETVVLRLSSPANATLSGGTATLDSTGTITDDDAAPVLSIDNPSVTEGDTTPATLTFTVTLATASGKTVTVNYADRLTGTATSATDYTALTAGTLTFAPGDTAKTIDVTVAGDTTDESNETVVLRLSSPANATLFGGAATLDSTGTVTDDDAAPSGITLAVDTNGATAGTPDTVAEGAGATVVTVSATVDGATRYGTAQTVKVSVGGGTAVAPADYAAVADFTITIPLGAAGHTETFTLTPVDDALDEPNETVNVTGALAGSTITPATVTLTDNDDPPSFSIAAAEADEGAPVVFTVRRAGATANVATVKVATAADADEDAEAAAASDYTAITPAQTLSFGAGVTSQTVSVATTEDDRYEPDETFLAVLSAPALGAGDPGTGVSIAADGGRATGTIKDDDVQPSFRLADASATEGTAITFTVTRAGAEDNAVSVKWNTKAATGAGAAAATDYTASTTPAQLDFARGVTTVTFTVATTDDLLDEGNETFLVELTDAEGATITTAEATGTITDDDAAPSAITLAVDADTSAENVQDRLAEDGGAKTVRVTATLTGPTRFATAQTVTVVVGKSTDSATEGTDYADVVDQPLTIPAGAASGTVTFTLTPTDDAFHEANETIAIDGTLTGVTITPTSLTLTDDEATPTATLVLTPATIDESGDDNASTVTATLSGASSEALTLTVSAAPVSPAVAGDYTLSGTTLTIAAGARTSTGTVTLTAVDNDVDAVDKTVTVSATATGGNGVTAPANRTLTIEDDDTRGITVSAAVAGVSVAEADNTATAGATENQATYTVVLDSEPTGTVSISLESGATTVAMVGPDALTFDDDDWNTARTVTVTAVDDDLDNVGNARTTRITHTVSAADTDYAGQTAGAVTVTVTDDDAAPSGITLAVDTNGATAGTPDTVAEGAGATVVTVSATVDGATRYGTAQTVKVSVGGGTAVAPADYAAVADFTITIPLGAAGHTETFTLTPVDDALDEPNETVNVTGALAGSTITPATVTLTDNDDPPSFSIAAAEADEGAPVVFTVRRAGATANVATVKVATAADADEDAEAAAASDYTAITPAQTLSFGAGVTSQTVSVATTEDDRYEPDETFLAVLSAPALGAGDPGTGVSIAADGGRATGTIKDDDVQPSFRLADASATEGTAITFTVTRAGAEDNAVSVKWNTKAATGAGAAAATDYTASTTPAQLDFARGVTTVTFTVATTDDLLDEGNETFLVELTDAEGATITTAEATGTITDDDAAPSAITLAVDADTSAENVQDRLAEDGGAKTVRVTATLTGPTRFATAQTVTVVVGKSTDSATEGTDYADVVDQPLTIPAGAASGTVTFTLTPTDDAFHEANETIAIDGTLTGVTITPTSLTLTDDEATPTATLVLTPATIDESGDDNASTVTATLSGASSEALTLTVSAAPVSPAVAGDYTLSGTTLTIAAGARTSTGTVTLTAVDNDVDAVDKTVTVSATATGGNGVTAPANRTLTIEDDDTRGITVSAAVAGVSVAEADNTATAGATENQATYTVVLDSEPTGTVSISLESGATTVAMVGPDALTFDDDDWNTARTVTVTAVDDDLDNVGNARTTRITHTVSAADTDYAGQTAGAVTVTVTDDDAAPSGITLAVDTNGATAGTPDTVAEGAGATVVTVSATVDGATRYGTAQTVKVSVGGGTAVAPADYAAVADFTITIPLGAAGHTETFTLTPVDDALDEPNETVNVTGALAGSTITPATVTLTDNDDPPSFSIAAAEADEGAPVVFTVRRAGATANVATVKVATAADADEDAEAAAASDYTAITPAQTLSFGAGVTSQTVSVATTEDDRYEPDETFLAVLSAPALGAGDPGTGVSIAADGGRATGTIKDDDVQPSFRLADASATEGTAITFTVTRAGAEDNAVSVKWNTKAATGAGAAAATDYTASTTPAQLDFARGVTTVTFTVATTDDLLDEGNETFLVELTDAEGATITTAEATGTITDDDAAPSAITLAVDADTSAENVQDRLAEDGGAKTVRVTATLTGPTRFATAQTVTVVVGKSTDSATEGTDYADVVDQPLTIPAGAASGTVTFTLTPTDDAFHEANETIAIDGTLTGVTITPTSLTLTDDEATPTATLVLTPATIDESGDDNASTVTATLSGASSEALTLTVSAAPVSPAVAGDYTLSGTTLTIAAGARTSTGTVTLTAVDNDVDAVDKTVTVSATATGGNGVTAPANRTLTIEDDDTRGITVSAAVAGVSVAEADNTATAGATENQATYTVVLDSEPTGTVSISLESGATTVAMVGPDALTFDDDDWNTARTVTVTAVDDDLDNVGNARTTRITHTVSAADTDYAGQTAGAVTVTVTDDDAAPSGITLAVDTNGATAGTPDTVAEGAGATVVTVSATVDGATRYGTAQTVKVSVGGGTAVAPADYAAVADFTITIPLGAAGHTETFTLTPVDDALDEPNETVNVTGALAGSTITPATVTLTDNDDPPSFSIAAAEADEGAPVVFTVRRAGATANVATVKVATAADADEDAEAAAASDYTAITPAQTLSFGAGVTSQTVSVATTEDDRYEPDETFLAVLSAPALGAGDPGTGVSIAADGGRATGTIKDDDVQPSFRLADASATEGTAITFTVTRAGAEDNAVSVKWNTKAATGAGAAAATDYTASTTPAQLDFARGVTTVTFTVATTDDLLDEGNETFLVELTDAEGATITTAEATGTITDDDAAPSAITLAVDADTSAENVQDRLAEDGGAKTVRVTATLTGPTRFATAQTVTVVVGKSTDSATEGTDYADVVDQPLTIPAGAASGTVTFTLTPTDDAFHEANETIAIDGTLTGVTVTPTSVTLTDDDAAVSTLTLAVDADTSAENVQDRLAEDGGAKTVRVTATLTGPTRFATAQTVTVVVGKSTDSATEGTDYADVVDQPLTIPAGAASGTVTFTLTPTDDAFHEANETIAIDGTLTGVTVTPTSVTLTDDDAAVSTLTLAVDADTSAENVQDRLAEDGGAKTVRVTATLTGPTRFATAQTVTVVVGKSTDSATEGTDYADVVDQPLTIPAGAASGTVTFTLTPTDDAFHEANETIAIDGTLTGVTVTPTSVTLTDDDAAVSTLTLAVDADTSAENVQDRLAEDGGAKTVRVTATLTGPTRFATAQTVTVVVGKSTDSATEGTDYADVVDQPLTIPAGAASGTVTFTLTPTDDAFHEANETIAIDGTLTGVTVTPTSVTITDDDTTPNALTLSVDADTSAENVQDRLAEDGGAKTVRVTATLTGPTRFATAQTVTVVVGKSTDSATEGTDYADVVDQPLTIPAGAASGTVTFTLTPTDDAFHEANETIAIDGTLTGVTVTPTSVTLTDDDAAVSTLTLAVDADTSAENVQDRLAEDGGAKTVRVTATLTGPTRFATAQTVTVVVGKSTDSATEGTDYADVVDQPLTIPAGAASGTVTFTLTPTDDAFHEANETIAIDGTLTGVTVTPTSVTLTDDDAAVSTLTLAVDADTSAENVQDRLAEDGGAKTVRVTATLTGPTRFATAQTVTVVVGKSTDSATEGTDYADVVDQPLTIPAGAASGTVTFTLTPTDDAFHEANETIAIDGTLTGVTVTPTSVTITDDDTTPNALTLSVDADTSAENVQDRLAEDGGAKTVRVTATLTGPTRFATAQTVTVVVGKSTDSATEGTDYADVVDQPLTIPAGAASGTVTFTLTPTDDAFHEANETIAIDGTLTGVTVTPTSVTLTDDDAAVSTLTLAVDADTSAENVQDRLAEDGGAKTVRVTATLTGPTRFATAQTVTVVVGKSTDSATEGTDYADVVDQPLTIPAGAASGTVTFTLTPTDDAFHEANETIAIDGTLTGVTVTPTSVTLTDDDAAVSTLTLAVDADTSAENVQDRLAEDGGAKTVRVTATLTGPTRFATAQTVTVVVGKSTDSATEGTDYADVVDQPLTIPAGAASGTVTFTLTPTDDAFHEANETIAIDGTLTGVTVTPTSVTITDDDTTPNALTLSVDADTSAENVQDRLAEDGGAKTVRVTATLTGPTRFATAQTVTVVVGKSTDSATEGTDYADVVDQPLTIPAGAASGTVTFTLTPTDDAFHEANETIAIDGTLTGVTVTPTSVTITDDDTTPNALTLSVDADTGTAGTQTSVAEGGGAKTVRVTATLDGTTRFSADTTVTVTVGQATDSAEEGTDYAAVADQTLTIAANTASGTVEFALTPTDDAFHEADETIAIDGTLTDVTVTPTSVTITDDDTTPNALTLSVDADTGTAGTQTSVAEGGGAKTVRVTATLDGTTRFSADTTVTVTVGQATDSAEEGTDYAAVADQTLTIAANTASGTVEFALTPTDDAFHEDTESLSMEGELTNFNVEGKPLGVTVTGTALTIMDDDEEASSVNLSVSPASVMEGQPITVMVQVNLALSAPVTVPLTLTSNTAKAEDYKTLASISILANSHTGTGTIATIDNYIDDDARTFTVALGDLPATLTRGTPTSRLLTIQDDDEAGIDLSTASLRIDEKTDGTARYSVKLRSEPTAPVTVTVASDSTDIATVSPSRLTFTADDWDAGKTVTVTAGDNGTARVTHTASSADGKYAGLTTTFRVTVDEKFDPSAWLIRFARTHVGHVLDGIAQRMQVSPQPGVQVSLGGQAVEPGAQSDNNGLPPVATDHPTPDGPESTAGTRTVTAREVLEGTSFALTGEKRTNGSAWSVWGRVARSRFDGSESALALNGDVTTAMLGIDRWQERWLTGLLLTHGLGEGDYSRVDGRSGRMKSHLTMITPWVSHQLNDRITAWGAFGYGQGGLTFKMKQRKAWQADTETLMAATGARGTVIGTPEASGFGLAMNSDALWLLARSDKETSGKLVPTSSQLSRLRLGLEGSYRIALDGGGYVTPKLVSGVRHDAGDAETGLGIELGGGLAWSNPLLGLGLNVEGRTLLAHTADDFKNWGFAASLVFEPDPVAKRGPSFSLSQTIGGQANGGVDALFTPDPLEKRSSSEAQAQWTAEAAYGFPAFGGRFTGSPYIGFGLATGTHDYTLGWRLTPIQNGSPFSFTLKATRQESENAEPVHDVRFEVTTIW